jgi:hypothetical protein
MHETRNLIVVLILAAAVIWACVVWFVAAPAFAPNLSTAMWAQRIASVALIAILGAFAWYAFTIEDKMPDRLAPVVGPMYYDVDGLSFMPTIRVNAGGQAELCVYYQNRFENYAMAVVHLRPPENAFVVRPGVRDLHFTFKADGGDFGVLHQPIGVPRKLRGEVIDVEMAAVARYPRSHGDRLIKHEGMACGSFPVDWGQAFKVGVHEVSGEIELSSPVTVHLSLPDSAHEAIKGPGVWKQEVLSPGPSAAAVMS